MPEDEEVKKKLLDTYSSIMKKVKEVLEDQKTIDDILTEFPKHLETTDTQAVAGRKQRIDVLLEKAGLVSEEQKNQYQ